MDRAPIPPHERSWRHPSELGPTDPAMVSSPRSSSRLLLIATTGAVAATLIAVLAVTTLPDRAPSPVAVSATTMPPFSVAVVGSPDPGDAGPDRGAGGRSLDAGVTIERAAIASPTGLLLTGAPRSVAAPVVADTATTAGVTGRGAADVDADARVHLVTTSHVYRVLWSDLDRITAPDGSIVVDDAGMLLGTFVDGRFVAD